MSGLYHNPQLGDRLSKIGVLDRFLRLPEGTLSAVVSVTVGTTPEGLIVVHLSLDYTQDERIAVMGTHLAVYPFHQQQYAVDDARWVAKRFGLTLRLATPATGWTYEDNGGPHVASTDDDFDIGA